MPELTYQSARVALSRLALCDARNATRYAKLATPDGLTALLDRIEHRRASGRWPVSLREAAEETHADDLYAVVMSRLLQARDEGDEELEGELSELIDDDDAMAALAAKLGVPLAESIEMQEGWTAQKTKRGTIKAVGTGAQDGRTLYGKRAEIALRGTREEGKEVETRRDEKTRRAGAAMDVARMVGRFETLTPDHVQALRDNLPSMTRAQIRLANGYLQARLGGARRHAELVGKLNDWLTNDLPKRQAAEEQRAKAEEETLTREPVGEAPDKAKVKDPWEMSSEEYADANAGKFDSRNESMDRGKAKKEHARIVADRILNGQDVPSDRLAEYPHLDINKMADMTRDVAAKMDQQKQARQKLAEARIARQKLIDEIKRGSEEAKAKHDAEALKETLSEYLDKRGISEGSKQKILAARQSSRGYRVDPNTGATVEVPGGDNWYMPHYNAVKSALAAGKPVPSEVLADYPDLAAKYGTKTDKPNFTGTDSLGREWVDGKLVAKGDDAGTGDAKAGETQPDPAPSPADTIRDLTKKHDWTYQQSDAARGVDRDKEKAMRQQIDDAFAKLPPDEALALWDELKQSGVAPPMAVVKAMDAVREAGSQLDKEGVKPSIITNTEKETANGQQPEATAEIGTAGIGSDGVRQPDGGGDRSGGTGGNAGKVGAGPFKPKIINPRAELTRAHNPELVPQRIREHLTDTQKEGVSLGIDAMSKHGGFLLADGPGTGKTRQILGIGEHFASQGKKVLVVAPSEVIKPNWDKREMTGSYSNDSAAMGIGTKLVKGGEPLEAGKIHVTTYENLKAIKDQIGSDTVVLYDESHYMKNRDSARFEHGKEISDKAASVMYATATPGDKPLHLAHLARAKVFGAQGMTKTFQKLGMELHDQHIGGGEYRKVWRIDPKVGYTEAMRRISGLMDQMTKDGLMVRRELSMDGVEFEPSHATFGAEEKAEISRVYQKVLNETGGNKAVALMAARNAQEPMKIPHTVGMAKSELQNGRQVVVFLGRVNDIDGDDADDMSIGTAAALRKALIESGVPESDIGELHGGATKTPAAKKKAMAEFQSGKKKVMIATVQSGGTGINLDDTVGDKPRSTIMMTPAFSANDMAQAIGRTHRLNTKSGSRILSVLADTPVDEWNAALLAKKFQTMGAVVGKNAIAGQASLQKPDEAPDDAEPTPYDWGTSLLAEKPKPIKISGNTYDHKDRIKAAGGRWTGDGWEIDPESAGKLRSLGGLKFSDAPTQPQPQQSAPAASAPATPKPTSTAPKDPAKNGFMRNKFDTWSNGQKIPAGKGWVKNINGKWVGFTHEEAVKRIGD